MKIQGPNGLVFTVTEDTGQALLVNDGFRRVEDKPKAEPKPKSKK